MILNIGIWRFPNIGLLLPLNHPFYFRIHDKPSSYWGIPTMESCSRFFSASSISDKRTASAIHEDMFKPGWRKIHQVPFLNLKGFLYHPLPNYVNVTFRDYYEPRYLMMFHRPEMMIDPPNLGKYNWKINVNWCQQGFIIYHFQG